MVMVKTAMETIKMADEIKIKHMGREALFESLFDMLDGVVYCQMIFDAQGQAIDFIPLWINKNFESFTGLKNVIGEKITELVSGIRTSNPELFEICGRISLAGGSERLEAWIGVLSRWFLISVYSSKKNFFVAIFQNISDRKQIERDLENAKIAARNVLDDLEVEKQKLVEANAKEKILTKDLEKFKLAVDNVSDNIMITDPEGTVIYANKAVEKITGYKPEEVIGKKSGFLWKTSMPAAYYQNMWDTIKNQKKVFIGEIQNKRKDGEIYVAVISISPIFNEVGGIEFFVRIERDITKEKEIEKAKSEFVSLASHQLRSPLVGIEWTIELFSKKEKLTDEGKKYLNDIYFSAKRLSALIKLLLNVSRIESGDIGIVPQSLDLVEYISTYIRECSIYSEKRNISFIFTKHPEKLTIITDKNIFGYILQNLVSNAIEYTLPGGCVQLLLEEKKDSNLFTIRDTGIGIPKKEQARIFEKFIRASNAVKTKPDGTGLGLYIVRESVSLLGGKIWFESDEGKGSTFFVELPLTLSAHEGKKGLVLETK